MVIKVDGLRCVCGSNTVAKTYIEVDGFGVNQLYCPNCGIFMRSPEIDRGGEWLKKHWEAILMRKEEFHKIKCKNCAWWMNQYMCKNENSAYYGCECSSVFGCEAAIPLPEPPKEE